MGPTQLEALILQTTTEKTFIPGYSAPTLVKIIYLISCLNYNLVEQLDSKIIATSQQFHVLELSHTTIGTGISVTFVTFLQRFPSLILSSKLLVRTKSSVNGTLMISKIMHKHVVMPYLYHQLRHRLQEMRRKQKIHNLSKCE